MTNPVKLGIVNPTPSPTASAREWSEWADSIVRFTGEAKFAIQGLTGNPSINLEASTTPSTVTGGGSSGGQVTSLAANGEDQKIGDINLKDGVHIDVTQSGQDFTVGVDTSSLSGTYLERGGGNSVTGIILPDGDATRNFGSPAKQYSQIWSNFFLAEKTLTNSAGFGLGDSLSNSQGIFWFSTAGPQLQSTGIDATHYQSGDITQGNLRFLAIEGLTPLNFLKAATATYDMDGNTLTDFGGCPSSNAALLTLTGNVADGSSVVGIRFAWDANVATPTTGAKICQWGYIDNVDAFKEVLSLKRTGFGGWTLRSPETADIFQIGIGAERGLVDGAWITMDPDDSDGSITFFVGTAKLKVSENGGFQLFGGMALNSDTGNPINFVSGEDSGGYGFSFIADNVTSTNGIMQFGTNASVLNRAAAGIITGEGHFLTGGAGFSATNPTDGLVGAQGWRRNNATNATGSDLFVAAGPGTGNSALKGDMQFQTPDTTSSGSAKQALTTKATLTREGNLGIGTATPDNKLTVNGDANISNGFGLIIGHTAKVDFGATPEFQVLGTATPDSSMGFARFENNSSGPDVRFLKSRGITIGANTIVQSGDKLGRFRFQGADGGDFNTTAAEVSAEVDGTPALNNIPGRLVFTTRTDGGSLSEKMRLDNAGQLGIGTTTPDALLEVALDANTPPTMDADTAAVFTQASATGDNVNISLIAGATGSARLQFGDTANEDVGTITYDHNSNTMAFTTNASEAMRIDSSGLVGIGLTGPSAQLHVDQSSATGAKPVLRLDQGDIDDSFIDYIGTSAADGSRSISSDTTEDSTKFGAIRIEINGVTKWIRVYDDES